MARNTNSRVRRILVFRIGELGDTLVALPSLRAVRRAFPAARLALLRNVNPTTPNVDPKQVLPSSGLIDEWISYESAESDGGLAYIASLLLRLRRARFDTLIYLAPRIRKPADIRRDLLFFRLAGIKTVIGARNIDGLPQRVKGLPLPIVEHEVDHLLSRLAADGIDTPPPGVRQIDLALTSAEQDAADSWLLSNVPTSSHRTVVAAFGPGSKWQSKVWPENSFAELGRRLIRELDIYPIVFGGAEDKPIGNRLLDQWGRGANAAGALAVRPAAAALSHCDLYMGNDTGTMHLAAAVGTPCVAIMSAQDWPGRWGPYGEGHTVLRRSVSCEGCMLRVCTTERLRCLTGITADEVVEACSATLERREVKPDRKLRESVAIA